MKPRMSAAEAVADVADGATVLIGGFGDAGYPLALVEALAARRPKGLTIISNNAGRGGIGTARLLEQGAVTRLVCSYPLGPDTERVQEVLASGSVDLELVPQGTLAERIRAAGAGLGGVLTPTGLGTRFAEGLAQVAVDGRDYLVATALHADVALIGAHVADPWGNLRYRYAGQNFNPVMAMAGAVTIAQVAHIDDRGLEATAVHTPGIFVDRLVVDGSRA
jgi:3-oxoadipate CoA-transferase, alpha subunit